MSGQRSPARLSEGRSRLARARRDRYPSRSARGRRRTLLPLTVPRPSAEELLHREGALLSSSHLRELGLGRRAIEAVFRGCPVVQLDGYARPLIRVEDFRAFVEASTNRGDRVGPG
jgi:hypothetical protein